MSPANSVPEVVGRRKKAKLAICNLQKTPLDKQADLRVHTRTDDLMIRIMDKLQIPIPAFTLRRRLAVEVESQSQDRHQLKVSGVDVDGTPVSFLKSVKLAHNRRAIRSEPFIISIRDVLKGDAQLDVELEFMGHYGEPNLVIPHNVNSGSDQQSFYLLEYTPQTRRWKTSRLENVDSEPVSEPGILADSIAIDLTIP